MYFNTQPSVNTWFTPVHTLLKINECSACTFTQTYIVHGYTGYNIYNEPI